MLELAGAFAKDPQRRKAREGEPELPLGVGEPPKRFDAGEAECWNELAQEGAAWLTRAARPMLEQAAKLLARDRREPLKNADGKRYDKLCSELGFSMVSITRMKVPSAAPKSKLDKFA